AALEHITFHRQLSVLLAQPGQLRPLTLAQRTAPIAAAARISVHPVAQGARVDAQIPGHLRDRLPGLPDQPDRALPEISAELPACLRHRRSPLRRCLHATRGSPLSDVHLACYLTSAAWACRLGVLLSYDRFLCSAMSVSSGYVCCGSRGRPPSR